MSCFDCLSYLWYGVPPGRAGYSELSADTKANSRINPSNASGPLAELLLQPSPDTSRESTPTHFDDSGFAGSNQNTPQSVRRAARFAIEGAISAPPPSLRTLSPPNVLEERSFSEESESNYPPFIKIKEFVENEFKLTFESSAGEPVTSEPFSIDPERTSKNQLVLTAKAPEITSSTFYGTLEINDTPLDSELLSARVSFNFVKQGSPEKCFSEAFSLLLSDEVKGDLPSLRYRVRILDTTKIYISFQPIVYSTPCTSPKTSFNQ